MTVNKYIEKWLIEGKNPNQITVIFDKNNNIIYFGKIDFAPLNLFFEVTNVEIVKNELRINERKTSNERTPYKKNKIIIKYYSGKSQNDGVFYGDCTTPVIYRELNRTIDRINNNELLTALVIFPNTNQYFVLYNPKHKIEFDCGYMSDEEYKTFVLKRYFNQ